MKRCSVGHFYDENRYVSCPHCGSVSQQYSDERERVTVSMPVNNVSVEEVARLLSTNKEVSNAEPRTVGLVSNLRGNDYVTGWLVCVNGMEYGRDYRLHHGFNRIGRVASMDIMIPNEKTIVAELFCQIVYENKENVFYIVPNKGVLVYLNGNPIYDAVIIQTGDKIEVGETTLQFIAFCEGERIWKQ